MLQPGAKSRLAHGKVAATNALWDIDDPTECEGFQAAERYSNKLNGQDPTQVAAVGVFAPAAGL